MLNERKGWVYYSYILSAFILFTLLGVRLFYLQVIRGEYYRGLSSQNHIRVVIKPAPRGHISDRGGIVLADSRPSFIVTAIPSEFDSSETELVAGLLGMSPEPLIRIMEEASSVPHRPVVLREGMGVEDVSSIAENIYRIPGVMIDVAPLRRYHRPRDFCHLIGYVGLADDPEAFRGEVTGRTGIEKSLNDVLHGTPGLHREVVDAMGRVVEEYRGTESEDPEPGENITITLDAQLQRIARLELENSGYSGAVVVIDFETGEILCAASNPTYDTNMFTRGISTVEWNSLMADEDNPMYCRAWTASYPPASTFKIVTAYWLLSQHLIDAETMPNPCYGSLTLGGTDFGCWAVHGRLDVVQALAQSCDVFFYRTCQLGSMNDLAETAAWFGLGRLLVPELPDERQGLVPDTRYLDETYGEDGWGLGNLLNLSIGQGELLATPLQMAVMVGVTASRGSMPMPTIIGLNEDRPPVMPQDAVDDEAFDIVIEGMFETVESSRGTLRSAFRGFPRQFWGKTGTAECGGDNHAMVVGFIREPEPLAICVFLEHGLHGGSAAGPVARNVLSAYLQEGDPQ